MKNWNNVRTGRANQKKGSKSEEVIQAYLAQKYHTFTLKQNTRSILVGGQIKYIKKTGVDLIGHINIDNGATPVPFYCEAKAYETDRLSLSKSQLKPDQLSFLEDRHFEGCISVIVWMRDSKFAIIPIMDFIYYLATNKRKSMPWTEAIKYSEQVKFQQLLASMTKTPDSP